MRRAVCFIFAAAVMLLSGFPAFALDDTPDTAQITERLYHESGADRLESSLPEDARRFLESSGFTGFTPNGVSNVDVQRVLSSLGKIIRQNTIEPFRVLVGIFGIVLLSAALRTVGTGGSSDGVLSLVTSLCTISVIAPPVLGLTSDLADTITVSGNFMLLYVPVISGLIVASGAAASGYMYCGVMVFVSNAVMQIASMAVVPLLKCLMSLSLVSSACISVKLGGLTELFRKASRFVLTFCMSLFAAFLTMRSIVAAAADSLTNRAVKFAVSSFVPLVGGALSEAYQTVISCVSILKAGVGAAAIAAVFAMFIPAAVRCLIWQSVTSLGAAMCGIFGLDKAESLLVSLSNVVSVMFAVLMCTMVIYMISTAVIIIAGG